MTNAEELECKTFKKSRNKNTNISAAHPEMSSLGKTLTSETLLGENGNLTSKYFRYYCTYFLRFKLLI